MRNATSILLSVERRMESYVEESRV